FESAAFSWANSGRRTGKAG
ncbi:hypothetical protein VCHENC02_2996B, partial [Vibrio harveyi]